MTVVRIESVTGRRELVDMLDVRIAYGIQFGEGRDCALLGFEGGLVFYEQPLPDGVVLQGAVSRRFPLRWVPRADRMVVTGKPGSLDFEGPCDGETLERIEKFRDGGGLHLRLEGEFRVLKKGGANAAKPEDGWMKGTAEWFNGAMVQAVIKVCSKTETRVAQSWSQDVLSVLRSPGSFFLEFNTPTPTGTVTAEVLENFKKAQIAFDRGGYDEVARILYVVLEVMKGQVGGIQRPVFVKSKLLDRIKDLNALCNRERHKQVDKAEEEAVKFDRPLAHDALASTASLIGLVFRTD